MPDPKPRCITRNCHAVAIHFIKDGPDQAGLCQACATSLLAVDWLKEMGGEIQAA